MINDKAVKVMLYKKILTSMVHPSGTSMSFCADHTNKGSRDPAGLGPRTFFDKFLLVHIGLIHQGDRLNILCIQETVSWSLEGPLKRFYRRWIVFMRKSRKYVVTRPSVCILLIQETPVHTVKTLSCFGGC